MKTGRVAESALAYHGKVQPPASQDLSEIMKQGLAGWVVEHRQAALLLNTIGDPRWLRRPWENEAAARSAISVPLMTRERVFGVLTLVRHEAGQFAQDDLTLVARLIGWRWGLARQKVALQTQEAAACTSPA